MQIFAILHFTLNLPVVEHLCDVFCKHNTNIDTVAESLILWEQRIRVQIGIF